jgi:serine/threonine protein kinase
MAEKLGRYEILEEIGRGGFAIVYRARDTELDRLVALKELKPVLLQDADWVRRFRREARAIAHLDHPRIVPVYDVAEINGRLFIIMRLVGGPSLEDLIATQGPLPWSEVVSITTAVAEGLDYAHGQGVLHRDLKPANILIDPERGPMLTDFGLAKLAGESSTSVTAGGGVVGTPNYIAPEVWESEGSTPQTDIYALGCVVYEMLRGEKVFKGETTPAVMMAHFKPLRLPQDWPEGIPAGVIQVFKIALAAKPQQRYTTAGKLAQALAALTQEKLIEPQIISGGTAQIDHSPPEPITLPLMDIKQPPKEDTEVKLPHSAYDTDNLDLSESEYSVRNSKKWKGFLAHLGPYAVVIGMLAIINLMTDPGGYLWFLWPAMGWGVGLAFHLLGITLSEMKHMSGRWRGFWGHFGSYAIIMGLLIGIYLMTDPGGYPWFVWPALGWGAAVAIQLWATILSGGSRRERSDRHSAAGERRRSRTDLEEARQAEPSLANTAIQAHLERARIYKNQIETLIKSTSDGNVHQRLQGLASQIDEWMQAVEALAQRIDAFQQNRIIRHDLETVPQSIANLEARLAQESDPATRTELERTLNSRQNQLAALNHLQNTMKRAEIKIESTLSALGTIYSQILIGQSTDHVADYGRLSSEVNEEVRTLQDHLEALEEVKLGSLES